MKTVKDAYESIEKLNNIKKSDWELCSPNKCVVLYSDRTGFFAGGSSCCQGTYQIVCTREEFEAYEKKMEGKTKQKTVKDAYEYFLINCNSKFKRASYKHISYITSKDEFYFSSADYVNLSHQLVCTREEFEAYAKEQEQSDKPVYTQEMADNGELPPVGSLVEVKMDYIGDNGHDSDLFNIEVLGTQVYYDKLNVIVESMIDPRELIRVDTFKPIDTRTDEEKLIDEVAELINDHIDDDAGSKCLAKEIINKLK